MDFRDRSILLQVSAKIAADLAPGLPGSDTDLVGAFKFALDFVHPELLNRALAEEAAADAQAKAAHAAFQPTQAPTPEQAVQNVAQAFPGTQVVQTAAPATMPQAVAPAALQYADTNTRWTDLLNNPGDWYDNRMRNGQPNPEVSLYGGNKPDFRHKKVDDKDSGYKIGLYLISHKFNSQAPDWVWARLGITPPGAAPAQAPAQPVSPFQPPGQNYGPDEAPF